MKQKRWVFAFACALGVMYSGASVAEYKDYIRGEKYVGVISKQDGTKIASHETPLNQKYLEFREFIDAIHAVYDPLRSSFRAAIDAKMGSAADHKSHQTSISGPIRFNYEPNPQAGQARVTVSAPPFNVHAEFEKDYGGLVKASCSVDLTTGAVVITADGLSYDTGALVNPKVAMNPSRGVACHSSISWVPGLGDLFDQMAYDKASANSRSALEELTASLQSQLAGYRFFGIPTIPSGQFVANGVDYGAYIKNNLPYLLSSNSVELYLNDPDDVARSPSGKPSKLVRWWDTRTRMYASFKGANNDGLKFELLDMSYYESVWVCPNPKIACMEP